MGERRGIEDLPNRREEQANSALEGKVGVREAGRVLAALQPLGRSLAGGEQERDEADELAHGDVAEAEADHVEQLSETFRHLRVLEGGSVSEDRVGLVEAGVEPLVGQALDHARDDTRCQQVAEREIDGDDVICRRVGLARVDEVAGGADLAKGLVDRAEAAGFGRPLQDVERPLVDGEDKGALLLAAARPGVQGLVVGDGVGVGDDFGTERFQLRPEPLDEVGLAVTRVAGDDDLLVGLGLFQEVAVDSQVDMDCLKFVLAEPVGVAVGAAVEPLDEGAVVGAAGGDTVGRDVVAGWCDGTAARGITARESCVPAEEEVVDSLRLEPLEDVVALNPGRQPALAPVLDDDLRRGRSRRQHVLRLVREADQQVGQVGAERGAVEQPRGVMAEEDVGVQAEALKAATDEPHLGARPLTEEVVDPPPVGVGETCDLVQRQDGLGGEVDGAEALGHADALITADGVLNLPAERHSHGLRRMCAIEAARGSFEDASEATCRATGQRVANRQVQELARSSAVDFERFYASRRRDACEPGDTLVLSCDGKGVVMRPEALREQTRKQAQNCTTKLKTRLSKGEKRNRKRMAEVGAVYEVTPTPRTTADILPATESERAAAKAPPTAKNKWLCASVTDDAAQVVGRIFDEAGRRDPDHQRPWIALVDGNNHQIDRIKAEAKTREVNVAIVCDFIHVLQYLWKAAWCFHREGDPAAETWVRRHAQQILAGKATRVAGAIRRQATLGGLDPPERAGADQCAAYLTNKRAYLDYPTALTKGWPIATGVIEGACRHLVKDRMDLTGARWGLDGAEAILKLRAIRQRRLRGLSRPDR